MSESNFGPMRRTRRAKRFVGDISNSHREGVDIAVSIGKSGKRQEADWQQRCRQTIRTSLDAATVLTRPNQRELAVTIFRGTRREKLRLVNDGDSNTLAACANASANVRRVPPSDFEGYGQCDRVTST